MQKRFWYVILSLSCYVTGLAQVDENNYFTRNYLFQERLAKGLVFDIIQDRFGFLWFGTEYGLIRYDGHQLESFVHVPSDPNSLGGNVVTTIAEDSLGNLWVGTMHSGLHYFDRSRRRFTRFRNDPQHSRSIRSNKVNQVFVTRQGSVWVLTQSGGVQLFEPESNSFHHFDQPKVTGINPRTLFEDGNGNLWLGGFFGLSRWDPLDSLFILSAPIPATDQHLKSIAQTPDGQIWGGYQVGGLKQWSPETGQWQAVATTPAWPGDVRKEHIWDLHLSKDQELLIATDNGLFHLPASSESGPKPLSTYHFTNESRFLSIEESRDGMIWLGTNNGVIALAPRHKQFHFMPVHKPGESREDHRGVAAIEKGDKAQLWVGTNRGLFQFDRKKQLIHQDFFQDHPLLMRFDSARFASLFLDSRQDLWLCTIRGFDAGFEVFRYQFREKQLTAFTDRVLAFSSFATLSIAEAPSGDLWFGNHDGLIRYELEPDRFTWFRKESEDDRSLPGNRINRLWFSGKDSLWVCTTEAGFALFNTSSPEAVSQTELLQDTTQRIQQRVITAYKDQHKLWLGTAGGLMVFNTRSGSLRAYDHSHGLRDHVIKSLMQDQHGNLWIGSKNALSKFEVGQNKFTNFGTTDGLEIAEFWERTGYRDEDGLLYFGGDDGLQFFQPDSIRTNPFRPTVVFTKLFLFNEEVLPSVDHKLLPAPLYQTPTLQLNHNQNVFSIHFTALSYINSQKNQYAIRMEGFEEDWQYIGHKTEATYTNLDPGTYYFRVRATNNDGLSGKQDGVLKLIILPPWYATWLAYLTYGLLLFSGIYFLYRFQLNRKLAQAETRRLRELDTIKTQLYTNITHEFRTPLTLIQGPVDKALSSPSFSLSLVDLKRIRQNCRRLLHLIRQMLHLNKLEAGAMSLSYQHGDVVAIIRYIMDSFSSFAQTQEVKLQLEVKEDPITMDHDPEKLTDILSNLISNAIKFTPPGGTVSVRAALQQKLTPTQLVISVTDTGRGIPEEDLDRIFDRFYQIEQNQQSKKEELVSSGSGIGLALSKKLAELMEGTISVESKAGAGSTFRLALPVRHGQEISSAGGDLPEIYVPQSTRSETAGITHLREVAPDAPTILIVEDNADLAGFIAENLTQQFQVHITPDGAAGETWATTHIPDLIVSDVLMPQQSGFDLCKQLKNDQRTSHIPIILLTAKTDLSSRLTGFGLGADAYMAKPFSSEELLIRIENLLESRRRLQDYYRHQIGYAAAEDDLAPAREQEHDFLKKVRTLIEEQLEQGDYTIEKLAGDLFMSSTQLYRKMMALTGLSPSKFYRSIQIKQAKDLLTNSELSISEIAYRCGFNDPAYFSRVFTAQLGIPPSTYRERG